MSKRWNRTSSTKVANKPSSSVIGKPIDTGVKFNPATVVDETDFNDPVVPAPNTYSPVKDSIYNATFDETSLDATTLDGAKPKPTTSAAKSTRSAGVITTTKEKLYGITEDEKKKVVINVQGVTKGGFDFSEYNTGYIDSLQQDQNPFKEIQVRGIEALGEAKIGSLFPATGTARTNLLLNPVAIMKGTGRVFDEEYKKALQDGVTEYPHPKTQDLDAEVARATAQHKNISKAELYTARLTVHLFFELKKEYESSILGKNPAIPKSVQDLYLRNALQVLKAQVTYILEKGKEPTIAGNLEPIAEIANEKLQDSKELQYAQRVWDEQRKVFKETKGGMYQALKTPSTKAPHLTALSDPKKSKLEAQIFSSSQVESLENFDTRLKQALDAQKTGKKVIIPTITLNGETGSGKTHLLEKIQEYYKDSIAVTGIDLHSSEDKIKEVVALKQERTGKIVVAIMDEAAFYEPPFLKYAGLTEADKDNPEKIEGAIVKFVKDRAKEGIVTMIAGATDAPVVQAIAAERIRNKLINGKNEKDDGKKGGYNRLIELDDIIYDAESSGKTKVDGVDVASLKQEKEKLEAEVKSRELKLENKLDTEARMKRKREDAKKRLKGATFKPLATDALKEFQDISKIATDAGAKTPTLYLLPDKDLSSFDEKSYNTVCGDKNLIVITPDFADRGNVKQTLCFNIWYKDADGKIQKKVSVKDKEGKFHTDDECIALRESLGARVQGVVLTYGGSPGPNTIVGTDYGTLSAVDGSPIVVQCATVDNSPTKLTVDRIGVQGIGRWRLNNDTRANCTVHLMSDTKDAESFVDLLSANTTQRDQHRQVAHLGGKTGKSAARAAQNLAKVEQSSRESIEELAKLKESFLAGPQARRNEREANKKEFDEKKPEIKKLLADLKTAMEAITPQVNTAKTLAESFGKYQTFLQGDEIKAITTTQDQENTTKKLEEAEKLHKDLMNLRRVSADFYPKLGALEKAIYDADKDIGKLPSKENFEKTLAEATKALEDSKDTTLSQQLSSLQSAQEQNLARRAALEKQLADAKAKAAREEADRKAAEERQRAEEAELKRKKDAAQPALSQALQLKLKLNQTLSADKVREVLTQIDQANTSLFEKQGELLALQGKEEVPVQQKNTQREQQEQLTRELAQIATEGLEAELAAATKANVDATTTKVTKAAAELKSLEARVTALTPTAKEALARTQAEIANFQTAITQEQTRQDAEKARKAAEEKARQDEETRALAAEAAKRQKATTLKSRQEELLAEVDTAMNLLKADAINKHFVDLENSGSKTETFRKSLDEKRKLLDGLAAQTVVLEASDVEVKTLKEAETRIQRTIAAAKTSLTGLEDNTDLARRRDAILKTLEDQKRRVSEATNIEDIKSLEVDKAAAQTLVREAVQRNKAITEHTKPESLSLIDLELSGYRLRIEQQQAEQQLAETRAAATVQRELDQARAEQERDAKATEARTQMSKVAADTETELARTRAKTEQDRASRELAQKLAREQQELTRKSVAETLEALQEQLRAEQNSSTVTDPQQQGTQLLIDAMRDLQSEMSKNTSRSEQEAKALAAIQKSLSAFSKKDRTATFTDLSRTITDNIDSLPDGSLKDSLKKLQEEKAAKIIIDAYRKFQERKKPATTSQTGSRTETEQAPNTTGLDADGSGTGTRAPVVPGTPPETAVPTDVDGDFLAGGDAPPAVPTLTAEQIALTQALAAAAKIMFRNRPRTDREEKAKAEFYDVQKNIQLHVTEDKELLTKGGEKRTVEKDKYADRNFITDDTQATLGSENAILRNFAQAYTKIKGNWEELQRTDASKTDEERKDLLIAKLWADLPIKAVNPNAEKGALTDAEKSALIAMGMGLEGKVDDTLPKVVRTKCEKGSAMHTAVGNALVRMQALENSGVLKQWLELTPDVRLEQRKAIAEDKLKLTATPGTAITAPKYKTTEERVKKTVSRLDKGPVDPSRTTLAITAGGHG